jgi:hypothetical protein
MTSPTPPRVSGVPSLCLDIVMLGQYFSCHPYLKLPFLVRLSFFFFSQGIFCLTVELEHTKKTESRICLYFSLFGILKIFICLLFSFTYICCREFKGSEPFYVVYIYSLFLCCFIMNLRDRSLSILYIYVVYFYVVLL